MKLQSWKAGAVLAVCCIFTGRLTAQQLKLGKSPTQLDKNALLELNSEKQGFLLPRVLKSQLLAGGTLETAQDGMFVFVRDEACLYLKKNGVWVKVADYGSGAALNNWLLSGNTGATGSFLGNIDDVPMVIKSKNLSYLAFGRRDLLGLTDNYPDYTNKDQKVTYLRSALQFEAPGASFYKPMFFVDANGNFRMKGSSAGTDLFEFGATGTNNDGGFDFIIGDDGNEPIIFKSYTYNATPNIAEMMRIQSGKVGIGLTGMPARTFHVNGDMRLVGSAGTPTGMLGRDANGDVGNVGIDATLKMTAGVLSANSTTALWNASQIQGMNVATTTPGDGQVLKWNTAASSFLPADDITGGTSYGTLTSSDIKGAISTDPMYRLRIWKGNGEKVTNGPDTGPTGAAAWSVLSFQNTAGADYTTQMYFDKNTLALKEWSGGPTLTDNGNPWYKVVTTPGSLNFTDGGLIYASKSIDATSEVNQDAANLFWDKGSKELGIRTNNPNSALQVNGSFSLPVNYVPVSGTGGGTTTVNLNATMYSVVVKKTQNNTKSVNVVLPAETNMVGRIYIIRKVPNGTLAATTTVSASGGYTIDGGASITVANSAMVQCISTTEWVTLITN
jgi:hypothetical protein